MREERLEHGSYGGKCRLTRPLCRTPPKLGTRFIAIRRLEGAADEVLERVADGVHLDELYQGALDGDGV
ncbi:hypothetical protein [Agromyces sp. PvR057]|uniref:hypothetical protein n=1 Tax=Agromyces sp. PvR057 TaxID=3156403 RepID=UPI003394A9B8